METVYILLFGDDIIGVYRTENAAIHEAMERSSKYTLVEISNGYIEIGYYTIIPHVVEG